ncbi:MAG: phosphoribosylanthranilate isomerase [Eubacteriales bacterium]|nr:phosphoribosylanthranilate isomerase [Eubacteriales bacterium]
MTERIKICGLSRPCDILWANEAQPDFVGFVFARSRRQVTGEQAAALKKLLSPKIRAVGVFVNEEPSRVAELVREGTIDWVQLHGREDEAYLRRLRTMTDCPLIQAFGIGEKKDIERALESSADYLLLDNGAGGTGRSFDWSLLERLERPFFLAGGLAQDNIAKARCLGAYCLDVSSGAERDGYKDREKMLACVRAAKGGERHV